MSKQLKFDALIVGAGFAGIYQLRLLRDQGLSVKVIDAAGDVGGTWYWNRYPVSWYCVLDIQDQAVLCTNSLSISAKGAMSDTESYIYRFSWDKEDLKEYYWKEHYVKQPEVLAYLEHVVDRHDLRKHMQFNTELMNASFDESQDVWRTETSTGDVFTSRYLITALGLLSKQNWPDIKGINTFKGELYHTGNWPKQHDFTNKRVGVIGSGSTGVQVITALAKEVKELVCFQRNPQYSVPSGDGPVSQEYRDWVNANYDEIWDGVRNSMVAFGFKESEIPAMSVPEEERQRIFQENWDKGNGFRFMFGTFNDITIDEQANEAACNFIKSKIAETVKDPEKSRKLMPTEPYARRPLCDAGYYEKFNQDNVHIVALKETPIVEVTPKGVKTSDGAEHELDVIVFATGFDAVDGNYTRLRIHGRRGESLKDHWESGPTSYLGMCIPNFPNMFMITGPNGPFTNIPPTIETQVEFVASIIRHGEGKAVIETTQEAEDAWVALCRELCEGTIFHKAPSWIFGANIPGKKYSVLFYFGGLQKYRERLTEVVKNHYEGFRIDYPTQESRL